MVGVQPVAETFQGVQDTDDEKDEDSDEADHDANNGNNGDEVVIPVYDRLESNASLASEDSETSLDLPGPKNSARDADSVNPNFPNRVNPAIPQLNPAALSFVPNNLMS